MNNRILVIVAAAVLAFCGTAAPNTAAARGMRGGGGMGGGGMGGWASHHVHWDEAWGPQLGNKCFTCHDGRPSRRTVNYSHCIPCHSPDGAIDGVNDPEIGARYNWGRMASVVYDDSGHLRPGKERWCLGCHDDGTAVINGVPAPNIAGKTMTGDWQAPAAVLDSDFPAADNLLDGDTDTGNVVRDGTYIIFDLGAVTDISHVRFYTTSDQESQWQVYGSTDASTWTRILLGQSVIFAAPAWKVGPDNGWNESRLDVFLPVRYLKLVRVSPPPLTVNSLCEFEYKKDLSYGYFVNGHKIGCDNCHAIRSSHIDGVQRTYQADLGNYTAGYRLVNVEVNGDTVPAMEIPRTGCNAGEDPATSNDFALCFSCHDRSKVLGEIYDSGDMFQYPLQTNFRNDTHLDANGNVRNEHRRHIEGRGYCGNDPVWDSDWDGTPDSPMSCTACHNVHGSPSPAMARHGELASTPGSNDKTPMINLRYLDATGRPDGDLADVLASTGGVTQFYAPGPGTPDKNGTCRMCHNDNITYQRQAVDVNHGLIQP